MYEGKAELSARAFVLVEELASTFLSASDSCSFPAVLTESTISVFQFISWISIGSVTLRPFILSAKLVVLFTAPPPPAVTLVEAVISLIR